MHFSENEGLRRQTGCPPLVSKFSCPRAIQPSIKEASNFRLPGVELIGQNFHRASEAIAFAPKRSDGIKAAVIGMKVSGQLRRYQFNLKLATIVFAGRVLGAKHSGLFPL
ncbi:MULTISPECIES: hypothetical protein [unclassified Pseudovibrio]|uniref:hypothetical protein n=1 Tax=unclassified Pseudovibrio TaxID=2627060 RepID=UPI0007AE6968|nr:MULTISPECIES: hypothetical protein [unclassified Pseudovibrio]KZK92558.1 hypothetical protein PsW74_05485 [Pseudovibrio sp. W74]KZL10398.1 hypothetical protein PsAD14_01305 [Pseudovibrio sp. Ad14]